MELNLNELQRNVRHGKTPGGSEGVKNQSADKPGLLLEALDFPSEEDQTHACSFVCVKCDK